MNYYTWFRIRTQGQISGSVTISLNPLRRYLVTGGLNGTSGSDFAHLYIAVVCTRRSPDQIACGVRDDPLQTPEVSMERNHLTEILTNATRVTIKLRSNGGLHRGEGVIYDIT